MCSSKAPLLALAFASVAAGEVAGQPPILSEPRKPFAFSHPAGAMAQEKVWSAVVLASNPKPGGRPVEAAPELAPFIPKLSKFFGYAQFEVLGSATKIMDEQIERWLVPTQNFWVGATATRQAGNYRLNMEFYHDKRRILETQAILGPKCPLFIRGPMHKRGQLILVFEVKP